MNSLNIVAIDGRAYNLQAYEGQYKKKRLSFSVKVERKTRKDKSPYIFFVDVFVERNLMAGVRHNFLNGKRCRVTGELRGYTETRKLEYDLTDGFKDIYIQASKIEWYETGI